MSGKRRNWLDVNLIHLSNLMREERRLSPSGKLQKISYSLLLTRRARRWRRLRRELERLVPAIIRGTIFPRQFY